MARPKVFDYDPAHDEQIVTEGVTGHALAWLGFDLDRQIMHIVVDEGVLAGDGLSIESITRSGQQVTLEGQDVVDFYTSLQTEMDAVVKKAMEVWAENSGKTGAVNA